jgi:hypothetical protein
MIAGVNRDRHFFQYIFSEINVVVNKRKTLRIFIPNANIFNGINILFKYFFK